MRWYEDLYVGEKAKKHRYAIIQKIRRRKPCGYYVLTPSSNGKNLLDLYPARALLHPFYKDRDFLILGIAEDYEDAALLAARIVDELYRKTGAFDLNEYIVSKS